MLEARSKIIPKRHSLVDLAGAFLVLFIAFPYIQIIPSGSYTQPTALLLAGLLFFFHVRLLQRIPFSDRLALLGLAIIGVTTFLLTCFPYANEQEYKHLLNYLSPLVITVASLRYLIRHPEHGRRILQIAIFIWSGVAIIQKFINPTFATGLVGQWGEHSADILESGRGVISLAPEPTHHAFHILILAACLIQLDRSRISRMLILICIADAIILAASSSAVLALSMASLVLFIFYQLRWFLVGAVVFALSWLLGVSIDSILPDGSRIFMLISAVLAEPSALLSVDYSLNTRLGGMLASLIATGSNAFLPHGIAISSWEASREILLNDLPWLMDLSMNGAPSGLGILFFQIGALALPFFLQVFHRILNMRVGSIERTVLLAIPLIFLGQYYISAPSFSLLYACALFRLYIAKREKLRPLTEPMV